MDRDEIRSLGEELETLANWVRRESATIEVELEQEKEFDLGEFGYRSAMVNLQDEHYNLDVEDFWSSHAPVTIDDLEELAEKLSSYEPPETTLAPMETLKNSLDELAESEDEDQQALANTLGLTLALYERLRNRPTTNAFAAPTVVGAALPPSPLPWPGALRVDINYTDAEFPLRYQPPPGFDWCNEDEDPVRPSEVTWWDATRLDGTAVMHLDNKGRVVYTKQAPDADTFTGMRPLLYHAEREGIPEATGFGTDSPPRALDSDGVIIAEDHTRGTSYAEGTHNWDLSETVRAFEAVNALKGNAPSETPAGANEFAPPAPVSV